MGVEVDCYFSPLLIYLYWMKYEILVLILHKIKSIKLSCVNILRKLNQLIDVGKGDLTFCLKNRYLYICMITKIFKKHSKFFKMLTCKKEIKV